MSELVDTTEMYLKSIYEMMEDGVTPLRARIVERLGHSGPTVSQTIARMGRDGLLELEDDRKIVLTKKGVAAATEVIRKHRLAERLLTDVIGLSWVEAHDEACRWEHVMSDKVENLLQPLLKKPTSDPYGNPIPGQSRTPKAIKPVEEGVSLSTFFRKNPQGGEAVILRIGEPVQAVPGLLDELSAAKMLPGSKVNLRYDSADKDRKFATIMPGETDIEGENSVTVDESLFKHFFVKF